MTVINWLISIWP